MERLMTLKLAARNCAASVRLNDFPLGSAGDCGEALFVPVHEYAVNGRNRLEVVIRASGKKPADDGGPAQALAADAAVAVHVLLPRVGQEAGETAARSLAQLEWSAAQGEQIEFPLRRGIDVDLPVSFPVWRWAKAPQVEPGEELRQLAFSTLREAAEALSRGDPEPFLQLTRLRGEELAQAYQRDASAEQQRLRTQLLAWHEAGALEWEDLAEAAFRLQPVAGGRLFECLDETGQAALRTAPDADGIARTFPLRFAQVAGKIYVLR